MGTPRILLVDDEEDIVEFLSYNLLKEGYQVKSALNGRQALDIAKEYRPHLIVLDIMMPELDGIQVCKKLRSTPMFDTTLVVFLTARSESDMHIDALDMGGDDFITKPIRPKVFISRIKAILRRHPTITDGKETSSVGYFGSLIIHYDHYKVTIDGRDVKLAKKEFDLLKLLSSKPGRVFKRVEILSKVWGREVIVGDRTIDVHIRKLREKIGSDYIHTMKGVGYKFDF